MMVSIIEIVLYTKPTAEHQYLLRSSCHPLQTKRAFPFSLALRIRRICSSNETSRYNVFIYTITHSHSSDSPTRILLVVADTTQPFAQYHLYFTSAFTFSHPPNFVLPCLNIYLSFPSYVLRRWTFAK